MTSEEINDAISILKQHFQGKISPREKKTFDIRPSINFHAIEISMCGRLYLVDLAHFEKVLSAHGVGEYVKQAIDRLRGKKFLFSAQNTLYDYPKVLRELNYLLKYLLKALCPNEVKDAIENEIKKEFIEVFQTDIIPELKTPEHVSFENKALLTKIINYNAERKSRK